MPPTEAKLNQNIRHYCRKIERHPNERAPLLRALEVLDSLKGISIAALSETGVGKTVNGLKRHEDGEVAARAKALVAKWKELVQKEEEGEEEGENPIPGDDPLPVEAEPKREKLREDEAPGERAQKDSSEPKRTKPKKRAGPGREEDEDGRKTSRHHRERESDESRSSSSSSRRHKASKKDPSTSTSFKSRQQDEPASSTSSRQHHKSSKRSQLTAYDAFDNALNGLTETHSAAQKQSKRTKASSSGSNGGCRRSSSNQKRSDADRFNSDNKNKPDDEQPSPSSSSCVPSNLCTEYRPLRQSLPIRTTTSGTPRLGATDDGALSELLAMRRANSGRRSAVYSGAKRSGYFGSVPSLQEICVRTLQENVDDIAECGGLPYSILRPIFERASPPTLMQIEEYNPYLMEDTGELWERFVRKNFPKNERGEMETWREVFERCTLEREQKLDLLKMKVKDTYKSHDRNQKKTKLAYVDAVAKPPRGVRKAQERNGIFAQVGAPHKKGSERAKPVAVRELMSSSKKPKVAPMMAKTLRMMKGFKTGFRR